LVDAMCEIFILTETKRNIFAIYEYCITQRCRVSMLLVVIVGCSGAFSCAPAWSRHN
jgi:hypothetical protein